MVDAPRLTETERRELIASLEEAQAQIARGEFVTFAEGKFELRLAARRALRRARSEEHGSKN